MNRVIDITFCHNGFTLMPSCLFPSHSQLLEKVFHIMITMCMDMHVLPKLVSATIVFTSFDLWMSNGGVNTFALVINYLIKTWEPMHILIEFFEVSEIIGLCIAWQLQSLFENFGLIHQVIACVKDGGNNLASMARTFCSIIHC